MSATDYWPSEEGMIVEGLVFFAEAYTGKTIAENAPTVISATTPAGQIYVETANGIGDAMFVALKAADPGDQLPIAESGLMKMTDAQTAAIASGEFVMNSHEDGVIHPTVPAGGEDQLKVFGGASYILGMAMQDSTTVKGSEIIVLLGKYQ